MNERIHVYPTSEEHSLESECWCEPSVEPVERWDATTGYIVIHNQRQ